MTRLLLSGYYGYGNAGDEAVLAGLVRGFRQSAEADSLELTVLSGDPARTELEHGIRAVDRYTVPTLWREIRRTDLFLSGGGSLLQDVTSAHGIFYYLGVVRLAQMLGKQTMFIAQGIGPLKLARSRRLVRSVANRLNAITVRDPDSAQLLRDIGVTRPAMEVTGDPALLLEAPPRSADGSTSAFGVALRPWPGQDSLPDIVADACRTVLGGHRALLLPMQPGPDRPVAEQFARSWRQGLGNQNRDTLCSPERGLDPLLANIAGCEMVVGMRLHALILAAAAGVPSVALSYDPKVAAFMRSCDQADAVWTVGQDSGEALVSLLARAWSERGERATALSTALPSLRAGARRNIETALTLVR